MKKFYIFILCFINTIVFISSMNKTYGYSYEDLFKDMVCEIGTVSSSDFEFDGYTIKNSNVNYNKEGDYKIIYEDNKTKKEKIKNIKIVQKESLINGITYLKTEEIILDDEEIRIKKVLELNDSSYIVAYNKQIDDYENEFGLIKLSNGLVEYRLVLENEVIGDIVDIKEDTQCFVVTASIVNSDTSSDVFVYKVSKSGYLLNKESYKGRYNDYVHSIFVDEHNYVLVGTTNSYDNIFSSVQTTEHMYVLIVDKESLLPIKLINIQKSFKATIDDVIVTGDYLYLASTYYDDTVRLKKTEIDIVSLRKEELINSKKLFASLNEDFVCFSEFEGNVYYLIENSSTRYHYIYEYTFNNNLRLIYSDKNKENHILKGFNALAKEEFVLYYDIYDSLRVNKYGIKYDRVSNEKLVFSVEEFFKDKPIGYFVDNKRKLLFQEANILKIADIKHIKLEETPSFVYYNEEYKSPSVYLNDDHISVDKKRSKFPNNSMFGFQSINLIYTGNELEVNITENLYVEPYCNISEGSIYDTYTEIIFNGEGTLNNQKIDSPYIIKNPGDYHLKIVGIEEFYEYNFHIEEISDNNEKDFIKEVELLTILPKEEKENNRVKIINHIETSSIPQKKKNNLWYILFPISLFCVFGFLVKKRG